MTVERYALETNTDKNYYKELYHTAMTISSSIELDQVLANIVEGVTKAMGVRATTLHLRDREDGQMQVGATYGAREGLEMALCAPLTVFDKSIGVIRVYTDEPVTFQDEDRKFLSILASLAAQAIENARLYDVVKSSYNGMVNAFLGI
jgi:GAF domain-containing protein